MMRKINMWNGTEIVEVSVPCRARRATAQTVVDPQRDATGDFYRWFEKKYGRSLCGQNK
jgi:hypothetical protein